MSLPATTRSIQSKALGKGYLGLVQRSKEKGATVEELHREIMMLEAKLAQAHEQIASMRDYYEPFVEDFHAELQRRLNDMKDTAPADAAELTVKEQLQLALSNHASNTPFRYVDESGNVWIEMKTAAQKANVSIATIHRAATGATKSTSIKAMKVAQMDNGKTRWLVADGTFTKKTKSNKN